MMMVEFGFIQRRANAGDAMRSRRDYIVIVMTVVLIVVDGVMVAFMVVVHAAASRDAVRRRPRRCNGPREEGL